MSAVQNSAKCDTEAVPMEKKETTIPSIAPLPLNNAHTKKGFLAS